MAQTQPLRRWLKFSLFSDVTNQLFNYRGSKIHWVNRALATGATVSLQLVGRPSSRLCCCNIIKRWRSHSDHSDLAVMLKLLIWPENITLSFLRSSLQRGWAARHLEVSSLHVAVVKCEPLNLQRWLTPTLPPLCWSVKERGTALIIDFNFLIRCGNVLLVSTQQGE